jgi:fatty acid desaturase
VIARNLLLLAGCCVALALFRNPWAQAATAVALGVVSGQLGFQLHDAGHNQMFHRRWKNTLVAFLTGNAMLGMSYGWWVYKHNRHHANPNHLEHDPDVNMRSIAYTPEQAESRRGVLRFVVRYQAFLFFPLTCLMAWSMHMAGARFLASERPRHRWLEIATLLIHAVVYVGGLAYFLGPWSALLIILIHKAVGGIYMASVFAPNHKGMLQVDEHSELDFLRAQVLTARNIRGGLLTDLWFGALNYQVEHHLFPTMARSAMVRTSRIVREFCAEVGVPYHETSPWRSYGELLMFLHEVGAPLRGGPQPAPAR